MAETVFKMFCSLGKISAFVFRNLQLNKKRICIYSTEFKLLEVITKKEFDASSFLHLSSRLLPFSVLIISERDQCFHTNH